MAGKWPPVSNTDQWVTLSAGSRRNDRGGRERAGMPTNSARSPRHAHRPLRRPPCARASQSVRVVVADARPDGAGVPVDRHQRENLVLAEPRLHIAAAIAPRTQLLGNPSGETDRRIGQSEGQRLRLGALDTLIARFIDGPLLGPGDIVAFLVGLGLALHARWGTGGMDANQPVRIPRAERARNRGAPVAAVGAKTLVPQLVHQGDPELGGAHDIGPLGRLAREAESGNRRHHDVECVGRVSSV